MKILLDACFIVSFILDNEKNHKKAVELYKQLENHELYINRAIIIEIINLLTNRLQRDTKKLLEIYKAIKYDYNIVEISAELSDKAMKTLLKYDGTLGLADTLNIETMKKFNIKHIYSFDTDFDNKNGIIRIH
jgi:predicted nucleic acid-binding protein